MLDADADVRSGDALREKTVFYCYRQNNSFGVWSKPAIALIIEADTQQEAEDIACDMGVYFDGCEEGIDCPCCGDRWYSHPMEFEQPGVYDSGDYMGHTEYRIGSHTSVPSVMIIHSDGNVETFD